MSSTSTGRGAAEGPGKRPKLSVCMIVRDNERTLEPCLKSIRPWCDELVVVDTGSLDCTPLIAKNHGAKVSFFPWVDSFAAARNVSLERATGEWLFWMDSDDVISPECGRKLREIAYGPHTESTLGYIMQVHCPGDPDSGAEDLTVVDHVKLLRNHPQIRFEGRIHEQVLPSIRRLGGQIAWTDVFVVHAGSDHSEAGRKRKYVRDLRLLQAELDEQPEHPFVLFNFGMTYADMGEHRKACGYLERSVRAAKPEESHLRKAYALWLGCLVHIDDFSSAERVAAEALSRFPDDGELGFRQGLVHHARGRMKEAAASYRRVLEVREERCFRSVDPGLSGFKTRHNLGIVYRDAGDLLQAELQWRLGLEERPGYEPSMAALSEILILRRAWATAEVQSEVWRERPETRTAGVLLLADSLYAQGRIEEAVERLTEAAAESPDEPALQRASAQRLFEQGRTADAREALQKLVELRPQDAAAWYNLGLARLQLGDAVPAAEAFRSALRLRPGYPAAKAALDQALAAKSEKTAVGAAR